MAPSSNSTRKSTFDQEGVEACLGLVAGGSGERAHPGCLGAAGLVTGDVAVPEVEVGGEEAGHRSAIVAH